MENVVIDGSFFARMIQNAAANLGADVERINQLNVFPVPDGDTGSNMKMTIDGGVAEALRLQESDLGVFSAKVARSMVLSARGNSGVILSQFFKGLSLGFAGQSVADVRTLAQAMIAGTKRAYEVVENPTEGTILTVMREAGEQAFASLQADTDTAEYLQTYLRQAKETLKKTPDLLPVLKKAGVIDSGGAGFLLVVEGMLKAVLGEEIAFTGEKSAHANLSVSSFNADSELTYGYCTEFILQLQNAKVNIPTFDLEKINAFLRAIGNSIVSFRDEDLVKVHVHTFDPGKVLSEMRKYGEFLTVKIENMNVQHTETGLAAETEEVAVSDVREHKKFATVAVANGEGLVAALMEMGVDQVVSGGQTMNTSTQDFLSAFEKIDAEHIFVFPDNGNILMAAQAAAANYDKAAVHVVPAKTVAQGFSAVSMLNFDSDDAATILEEETQACKNVATLELTYSIRDAEIDGITVCKDDFICLYNDRLVSADKDRLTALKKALAAVDIGEKQMMTMIVGKGVPPAEAEEGLNFARSLNPCLEGYTLDGGQDVYSYIIGLE